MFIRDLYRHNKAGCIIVIAFLLTYIYINFKWGVVATPVMQYGMYSSPFHIKDTQEVYQVEANKKIINSGGLSFVDRDIVQLYLFDYERQGLVNGAVYNTMRKYFRYTGLSGLMNVDKYMNHLSDTLFTQWYKQKLEKIINEHIISLAVFKQHFVWQQDRMQPTDSLTKLNFIVP